MEIKGLCFLKEVVVGRDLEAGGRASGREKEGCLERQQEKEKCQAGKRGKTANMVANETNGKHLGSCLYQMKGRRNSNTEMQSLREKRNRE